MNVRSFVRSFCSVRHYTNRDFDVFHRRSVHLLEISECSSYFVYHIQQRDIQCKNSIAAVKTEKKAGEFSPEVVCLISSKRNSFFICMYM